MFASPLLRPLLDYEIQHIFCLSSADYSTALQDPVPNCPVPFELRSALAYRFGLERSPLPLTARNWV
jgi:hypothetical protein